jgi:hypothetical protein
MSRGHVIGKRRGVGFGTASEAKRTAADSAAHAVCETLEGRCLLTTYLHTVTSGHPLVFLRPGPLPGQVDVRLDSPTGTLDHRFNNQTGMDVITNGSSNFTFYDQVPAALKPGSDGTDDGLKV